MKKNYFLTGAFLLASTFTFAQQNRVIVEPATMKLAPATADELKFNSAANTNKVFGDTLWYEDFGGGFSTNGWVSNDLTLNGFDWIYTTAGPGGQYSSTIPAIASTTTANGFASLRGDFYNTPTPAGGFLAMSTTLTSGPIVITPKGSIILRWQQAQRYCCDQNSILNLEVSNDNMNWVAFDASFGRGANTAVTENAEINISSVAANEDTIYIRFFQDIASHYYWMIDDIAVVEGPRSNVRLDEEFSSFGVTQFEGFYTQVPDFQTKPLSFEAAIENNGSFTATNVRLKVDVNKVGIGNVYSDSSTSGTLLPLAIDTFVINSPYANMDGKGDYTISYQSLDDSMNQVPASAIRDIDYKVTDSVFAKDYGVPNGSIGPGSYVGGDNDGSRMGIKFTMDTAFHLTSVSYYIADRAEVVGAEIRAKVWEFDTTQPGLPNGGFTQVVAQNPIPYTITTADRGTWLTIPMIPAVDLPVGQYVAAFEQSAGNLNGFEAYVGRDRVSEDIQMFGLEFNSFVFANDATPSWGNIFAQPMIRMNVQFAVGIDEVNETVSNFAVSPNPNNGQFKVNITAPNAKFTLNVRNIMGQVVYTENVSVQNSLTKELNLSNLDKGIYFVSVENEVSKEVKKVVIR